MKKTILIVTFAFTIAFGFSQEQSITICTENNGCELATVQMTKHEIDQILSKTNFLTIEKEAVILNLVECESSIEKNKTLQAIHESYGGKGTIKKRTHFDLKKYLFEKGCKACPNPTKRVSFNAKGDEFTGSAYCYINVQKEETFVPNDSWQQLYQGELGTMVLNTFMTKQQQTSYIIDPEGVKRKFTTPYGSSLETMGAEESNEKFKKNFKRTNNQKQFLNTNQTQYEYIGKDATGAALTMWLTPSEDVCLPKGKVVVTALFNLGYIAIDGITYMISEIEGSNFHIEVTGMELGSYSFDTSSY